MCASPVAPHPIDGSYWVAAGELLAGPHPGLGSRPQQRTAVRNLVAAGIRTIVDLTTPSESAGGIRVLWEKLAPDSDEWTWMRHPILDGGVPSTAGMQAILDAIDASRSRKRPVYVHCMGGLGRTGVVAACWWIRHEVLKPGDTFAELGLRRQGQSNAARPSPETSPQFHLIRSWKPGQ